MSAGFDSLSAWHKATDLALHVALTVTALVLTALPVLVRHIRATIAEALDAPFVRAAAAHGIGRRQLVYGYALRAAANPLVALVGFSVGTLLSGSLLVEIVMSWPGLGPGFSRAALDILHHHESYDGKGYPAGLRQSEIPIVSRIVSVIDANDAMVSSRPYRNGLPSEEAIRRLLQASGTQFDPLVVQCFLSFAQSEMDTVFAAAGTSTTAAL